MNRLLLCSMSVPWPDRPTLGQYHVDQALALRRLGVQTVLFSPAPRVPARLARWSEVIQRHVDRPERYRVEGIEVWSPRVPFAFPRFARFHIAPQLPRALSMFSALALCDAMERAIDDHDADGLLVHGVIPWGHAAMRVARRRGIPFGVIEHSAEDVQRLRRNTALGRHYTAVSESASAVIVPGGPMARHLEDELGLRNVRWVPNGLGRPARAAPVRSRREVETSLEVLAAGHAYRRKGFEELVEGFELCAADAPGMRLSLVTAPTRSLRRTIAASPARDRIEIVGPLPHDALLARMASSDLFALPSWGEAFGLVYLEAMRAGLPVVMSRDCGLAPLIRDVRTIGQEAGWVVEPHSTRSVAETLREVWRRREELHGIGRTARRLVIDHFSWSTNAAEVIRAMTRQSPGRPVGATWGLC